MVEVDVPIVLTASELEERHSAAFSSSIRSPGYRVPKTNSTPSSRHQRLTSSTTRSWVTLTARVHACATPGSKAPFY